MDNSNKLDTNKLDSKNIYRAVMEHLDFGWQEFLIRTALRLFHYQNNKKYEPLVEMMKMKFTNEFIEKYNKLETISDLNKFGDWMKANAELSEKETKFYIDIFKNKQKK